MCLCICIMYAYIICASFSSVADFSKIIIIVVRFKGIGAKVIMSRNYIKISAKEVDVRNTRHLTKHFVSAYGRNIIVCCSY